MDLKKLRKAISKKQKKIPETFPDILKVDKKCPLFFCPK